MANSSAIITFILAVIFIIAAVLITISSVNLYAFRDTDPFLAKAYDNSTWGSVISWILVALVIIAFFLYVYYYAEIGAEVNALETIQKTYNTVSGWNLFFIIILLVLLFFVGVLSALTASNMKKSPNYNSMNAQMSTAYTDAVVAAILSLVAGSLVIIWFLVDLFYYFYPSGTDKTKKTEVKEATISPTVKVGDKEIELKDLQKLLSNK